jgi:ribosomal-protein-alanine N-acetyltransferase
MRRKFQELMLTEEPITGWESTFRDMPQLVTPHLLLRAPRMGDAQDMYDYSRDVEVARYVLWDAHRSIYETRSHLRHLIRRNQRGGPGTFAVVERQTNRMIGTIGYTWMDADNRSAEIGYSYARAVWGRGYGTEALREMLRFSFDVLSLNRVEGQHDTRNPASGIVMARAGMHNEGTLHQRIYIKGEFANTCLYAVTRDQWALRESEGSKT